MIPPELIRALRRAASEIVLRLPPDSPLAADVPGGEVISLHVDGSIFPKVAQGYDWHFADTKLELSALDPEQDYHLIDIGANVGLMTRQVMANFPNVKSASCFEPSPLNTPHLTRNLAGFETVGVHTFGLHREDGELTFYVDAKNGGNYSFNEEAVNGRPFTKTVAPVRAISEELLVSLMPEDARGRRLIWKSDTQGLDEFLISTMPLSFWDRVDVLLFEGWRIAKPDFDAEAFAAVLHSFPHAYYTKRGRARATSAEKIMEYLDADDRKWADFCLTRAPLH